jgi:ABC-type Mn2+/Zn2+ transport system permease subunit
MEITFLEIWELFRWALLAVVLAGAVAPLIGCFLLVRRTGFHGITLPQFAAAGIACGFAVLPWWIENIGLVGMTYEQAIESHHMLKNYLLLWAAVFLFGGLGGLVLLGRARETESARVAAGFALASAVTILFALASPTGAEYMDVILQGRPEVIGRHELEVIAVAYVLVGGLFGLFHRDFLLVSFDAETARVLHKRVFALEALLLALTGITVLVGTLTVGTIMIFGLLVLPPLGARGLARSMLSFYALSSLIGVLAAVGGFWASLRFDWPLGPPIVAVAALLTVPGWLRERIAR